MTDTFGNSAQRWFSNNFAWGRQACVTSWGTAKCNISSEFQHCDELKVSHRDRVGRWASWSTVGQGPRKQNLATVRARMSSFNHRRRHVGQWMVNILYFILFEETLKGQGNKVIEATKMAVRGNRHMENQGCWFQIQGQIWFLWSVNHLMPFEATIIAVRWNTQKLKT